MLSLPHVPLWKEPCELLKGFCSENTRKEEPHWNVQMEVSWEAGMGDVCGLGGKMFGKGPSRPFGTGHPTPISDSLMSWSGNLGKRFWRWKGCWGIPKSFTAHTPTPLHLCSPPKPTPEEAKLFEGRHPWLGLAFKDKNSADLYFLGILGKVAL